MIAESTVKSHVKQSTQTNLVCEGILLPQLEEEQCSLDNVLRIRSICVRRYSCLKVDYIL